MRVRVHGDNGVRVQGGARHAPGSEFAWLDGETLLLGGGEAWGARVHADAGACVMTSVVTPSRFGIRAPRTTPA